MLHLKTRTLSLTLVFLILIYTIYPNAIRNLPYFGTLTLISLLLSYRLRKKINKKPIIFLTLFCTTGLLYLIASIAFGNWTEDYLFDKKFIARQSYFIILFLVYVLAGVRIYNCTASDINNFIKKWGNALLTTLILIDIGLALLLGDTNFLAHNGYTFYLEKTSIWLFICYIYYHQLAHNRKSNITFFITTTGFTAEVLLGYGTMFNASTGAILYALMAVYYLFEKIKLPSNYILTAYSASAASVILFVFVAPFYPDFFANDLNTFWRLTSWQDNLNALLSNYGFGAGFGVSYFRDSQEAMDAAYKAYLADGSSLDMDDQFFIRGQHSSIINIAFRTGAIGLLFFLTFIRELFNIAKKRFQDPKTRTTLLVFVSGLINISVHVGIESPPFFITFALSIGLLIGASELNKEKYQAFNKSSAKMHE